MLDFESSSSSECGCCPVCRTALPAKSQWQQNYAIAAAIEEVGRVCTNELKSADVVLEALIHESVKKKLIILLLLLK